MAAARAAVEWPAHLVAFDLPHTYVAQVLRQDVGALRRRHCLRTWTRNVPESVLAPAERVRVAQWHLDAGELPEQEPLREAARWALPAPEDG
ncbi:hypothetical protein, partial [Streptomyces sp. WM6386]|uniref:hypothetical protein n=1 Tax=Streptomyces sp. WM6386 TaxID=1415558 RepID=UPI00061A0AA6